jgi:hypothetical protein
MKKRKPSLLDKVAAEQAAAPSLFLVSTEEEGNKEMERRGEFTAERLMESRPTIYRALVDGLGQGLGVRQLCRAYRVSHHTVAAVMARESSTVATLKERTVATLRTFGRLAADRLLDEVDQIPIQSLPIALGIAVEKAELLAGGATSRIEHLEAGPTHEDYLQLISGKVIEAEIIPATGLRGETDSLKGAAEPFEVDGAVQAEPVLVDAETVPAAGLTLLPGQSFPGTLPTRNDENDASPDEQSGSSEVSYSVEDQTATPSATLPAGLEPHIEGSKSILGHPGASDETTSAVPAGKIKTGRAAGSTGSRASKSKRTEGGRGSQKSAAVSRGH